jgi:hypothetical protein
VADLNRYYRALAAASKRVKVFSVGKTDEGRECLVAVVSDEEPSAIWTPTRATWRAWPIRAGSAPRRIASSPKAKPIYMFTGGLHSAETGPPEMLMELAYRLAVDESPLDQASART